MLTFASGGHKVCTHVMPTHFHDTIMFTPYFCLFDRIRLWRKSGTGRQHFDRRGQKRRPPHLSPKHRHGTLCQLWKKFRAYVGCQWNWNHDIFAQWYAHVKVIKQRYPCRHGRQDRIRAIDQVGHHSIFRKTYFSDFAIVKPIFLALPISGSI